MENHEFKITDIVIISEHTDTDKLKDLLEYTDDLSALPFKELTDEDFSFFDDWLFEQVNDKGIKGVVFNVLTPIMCERSNTKYYSFSYCREKIMHANSIDEAIVKAQAYANEVANDVIQE